MKFKIKVVLVCFLISIFGFSTLNNAAFPHSDNTLETPNLPSIIPKQPLTDIPSVKTIDVTRISRTTSVLNGILIDDGGEPCQIRFRYSVKSAEGPWKNLSNWHGLYSSNQSFFENITGLEPLTVYWIQAGAKNSIVPYGKWGNTVSFITKPLNIPVVTTISASNIDTSSAQLNGKIIDDGGIECYIRFKYHKKGQNPWEATKWEGAFHSNDNFSTTINNLDSDTTYQYLSIAKNSLGEVQNEVKEFTTKGVVKIPSVETLPIVKIKTNSIKLRGKILDDGGVNCEGKFRYRKKGTQDWIGISLTKYFISGDIFIKQIENLLSDKTYQYQAGAQNTKGETWGSVVEFSTQQSNKAPIAEIGGPYTGSPGEIIKFNASTSRDNDESGNSIVQYDWKFFEGDDWHEKLGPTPTYSYSEEGEYTISLRVLDNEGEKDEISTKVTIIIPNIPPSKPSIIGPISGSIKTEYSYIIESSDPDGDTICFTINWNDGEIKTSSYSNDSTFIGMHSWSDPGLYFIEVFAEDYKNARSPNTELMVSIDFNTLLLEGLIRGYLIDKNNDGVYDSFYNLANKKEIDVEKHGNEYWIDSHGTGWDYVYNIANEELRYWNDQDQAKVNKTAKNNEDFFQQIIDIYSSNELQFLPIAIIGAVIVIAELTFIITFRKKGFLKD
jgi:hypothetical protein